MSKPYFSNIDVFSALANGLDEIHSGLKISSGKMNRLIGLSTRIAEILNEEDAPISVPGEGVEKWLASSDVGASSKYMLSVLMPELEVKAEYAHPFDVSDFCRCLKLTEAEPLLLDKLNLMSKCSEEWRKLVDSWERIKTTIENDAPNWRDGAGGSESVNAMIKDCLVG